MNATTVGGQAPSVEEERRWRGEGVVQVESEGFALAKRCGWERRMVICTLCFFPQWGFERERERVPEETGDGRGWVGYKLRNDGSMYCILCKKRGAFVSTTNDCGQEKGCRTRGFGGRFA